MYGAGQLYSVTDRTTAVSGEAAESNRDPRASKKEREETKGVKKLRERRAETDRVRRSEDSV